MVLDDATPGEGHDSSQSDSADALGESIGGRVMQRSLIQRLFGSIEVIRLGRFSILESLGTGGMGAVYAAYDPELDRRVALKVLSARGARDAMGTRRLLQEAKVLAKLTHPSVISVHEVGVHDGRVFIAMELAPGGTLRQWAASLDDGPARVPKILERMRECIDGLAAAHDSGLVHRDFKPANVLIGADGRARVADFGLARLQEGPEHASAVEPTEEIRLERFTSTEQFVGTPAYMAPEQFEGQADARSDQFSLCVTFFELIYGTRPFEGQTVAQLRASLDADRVERPAGTRGASEPVFAVLARGLRLDPADRHESMRALGRALDRAMRPRRRVIGPVVGALGLMVAVGALVMAPGEDHSDSGPAGSPCTDGRDELAAAWGPARREAMKAAFEATEQPAWPGLWERVEHRFDVWTDKWSEAYRASCEATRVHGTQDEATFELRRLCMEQQRDRFAMISDHLTEVDPVSVYSSTRLSLELPRIEPCADRDELVFDGGRVDRANPAVREFYASYDQAWRMGLEYRNAEAEVHGRAALAVAEEAGLDLLGAQAARTLAITAFREGRYEEAERWARQALGLAERSRNGPQIVWAWHRLAIIARDVGRTEDENFFYQRALDNADGFDVSDEVRVQLLGFEAIRQMRAGNPAESARLRLEASEKMDRLGLHPQIALSQLGAAIGPLSVSGDADQARAVGERAIVLSEDLHGPTHPITLGMKLGLSQHYLSAGEMEAGLALSTFVIENLPPEGVRPVQRYEWIGMHAGALYENGRLAEALALSEETIAQAIPHLGASSASVNMLRNQCVTVLVEQERFEEALRHLEIVVGHLPGDSTTNALNRGIITQNYAEVLAELRRCDEALPVLDDAMEILMKATGANSAWRFNAVSLAGQILRLCDRPDRARQRLEQALAIAAKTDVDADDLAQVERNLEQLGR